MNGYAIGQRIKLRKLYLEDFLDFMWWWVVREASQEERDKFERWLWMPPKGVVAKAGPWSVESETSAFQSLKSQLKT